MFDDVYLVDRNLVPVGGAAVTALERRLGITLPIGYRNFVTTFGRGTYCDQVWVFLPNEVEENTAVLRKLIDEYFFWDRGSDVLAKDKVRAAIHIARSCDGDEIIYNPNTEHGVYVLPRHDDVIYWVSHAFHDLLDWKAVSGTTICLPPFRYFEPSDGRAHIELFTARRDLELTDVARVVTQALGNGKATREIRGELCYLLFMEQVGGRVQLTTSLGDGRVGIRVDYNPVHASTIESCVHEFESRGFYVTGRHPK